MSIVLDCASLCEAAPPTATLSSHLSSVVAVRPSILPKSTVETGRACQNFLQQPWPDEAVVVLRNAGFSWTEIAHELSVGRTTVRCA